MYYILINYQLLQLACEECGIQHSMCVCMCVCAFEARMATDMAERTLTQLARGDPPDTWFSIQAVRYWRTVVASIGPSS